MKDKRVEEKEQKSLSPEELMELAILQEELNVLKKEYGLEEEKKGFAKWWSLYFGKDESEVQQVKKERKLAVVNRKKYGWILALTGWFGGHLFYVKRYKMALLYLAFFWTGFPAAMAIVDFLIWIPKKPDEDGNIEV